MPRPRQDLRRALEVFAFDQAGYFTAGQALESGYTYQAQKYHADAGNWVRVDRGVFRLPNWPDDPGAAGVLAALRGDADDANGRQHADMRKARSATGPVRLRTPNAFTAQDGRGWSGVFGGSLPPETPKALPPGAEALLSPVRLRQFQRPAQGDNELAASLYLWDRDVAVAVLRDMAIFEVVLRNSLARALDAGLGEQWYQDPFFDPAERLGTQITEVVTRIADSGVPFTADRMISQLTLGFWVGTVTSKGSARLWHDATHGAFPGGGRQEARQVGARFERGWVSHQLRLIVALRNRAAHHEPLIRGIPLAGERHRTPTRKAVNTYLRVARMLDRDFGDWLNRPRFDGASVHWAMAGCRLASLAA